MKKIWKLGAVLFVLGLLLAFIGVNFMKSLASSSAHQIDTHFINKQVHQHPQEVGSLFVKAQPTS